MIVDPTQLGNLKIEGGVMTGNSQVDNELLSKTKLVVVADGVDQLLDHVLKEYPIAKEGKSSGESGKFRDTGFFMTNTVKFHAYDTYEETLEIFRHRPQELVKFDPAEIAPRSFDESGNEVEYNVTGDFIDMGRHLEGVPESMGSMHNGKARNRRVRILVDANQYAGLDENMIIHRSERVIRLIDALEAANVRTEMKVMKVNELSYIEVTVKKFDEPLTLEDVAITTHPDWGRRVCFRINEYSPTFRISYGSSAWLQDKVESLTSKLNDELTIYIHGSLENKVRIDQRFDELEKMVEEELSLFQPEHNMFTLTQTQIIPHTL